MRRAFSGRCDGPASLLEQEQGPSRERGKEPLEMRLDQPSPVPGRGCELGTSLPGVAPVLGDSEGVPVVSIDCWNDASPSAPRGCEAFAFRASGENVGAAWGSRHPSETTN